MAKKVTLILSDETLKKLNIIANSNEISMSAATAFSIEYFSHILKEKTQKKGTFVFEETNGNKTPIPIIPDYIFDENANDED